MIYRCANTRQKCPPVMGPWRAHSLRVFRIISCHFTVNQEACWQKESLPPTVSKAQHATNQAKSVRCHTQFTRLAGSAALLENQQNLSLAGRRGGCLFEADLVRNLCKEIVDETDPDKSADLLSLLHAVIKDDQEEVRLRALFLVKKYGHAFDDLKGAA